MPPLCSIRIARRPPRRSSHVRGGGEPESESSYLGFAAEACRSILSCRLRLMNASKSKGVEMPLFSPSISAARRASSSFSVVLLGMWLSPVLTLPIQDIAAAAKVFCERSLLAAIVMVPRRLFSL